MALKDKTAPLFDLPEDEIPPTDELPSKNASILQRTIASFVDLFIIGAITYLPFIFVHPSGNFYTLAFSLLLYIFDVLLTYHFLSYFFMGRTLGDFITGIRLFADKFSLTEAFVFSLVKTLFTLIPMNLILPFLNEENLTGEQLLFNRVYQVF